MKSLFAKRVKSTPTSSSFTFQMGSIYAVIYESNFFFLLLLRNKSILTLIKRSLGEFV